MNNPERKRQQESKGIPISIPTWTTDLTSIKSTLSIIATREFFQPFDDEDEHLSLVYEAEILLAEIVALEREKTIAQNLAIVSLVTGPISIMALGVLWMAQFLQISSPIASDLGIIIDGVASIGSIISILMLVPELLLFFFRQKKLDEKYERARVVVSEAIACAEKMQDEKNPNNQKTIKRLSTEAEKMLYSEHLNTSKLLHYAHALYLLRESQETQSDQEKKAAIAMQKFEDRQKKIEKFGLIARTILVIGGGILQIVWTAGLIFNDSGIASYHIRHNLHASLSMIFDTSCLLAVIVYKITITLLEHANRKKMHQELKEIASETKDSSKNHKISSDLNISKKAAILNGIFIISLVASTITRVLLGLESGGMIEIDGATTPGSAVGNLGGTPITISIRIIAAVIILSIVICSSNAESISSTQNKELIAAKDPEGPTAPFPDTDYKDRHLSSIAGMLYILSDPKLILESYGQTLEVDHENLVSISKNFSAKSKELALKLEKAHRMKQGIRRAANNAALVSLGFYLSMWVSFGAMQYLGASTERTQALEIILSAISTVGVAVILLCILINLLILSKSPKKIASEAMLFTLPLMANLEKESGGNIVGLGSIRPNLLNAMRTYASGLIGQKDKEALAKLKVYIEAINMVQQIQQLKWGNARWKLEHNHAMLSEKIRRYKLGAGLATFAIFLGLQIISLVGISSPNSGIADYHTQHGLSMDLPGIFDVTCLAATILCIVLASGAQIANNRSMTHKIEKLEEGPTTETEKNSNKVEPVGNTNPVAVKAEYGSIARQSILVLGIGGLIASRILYAIKNTGEGLEIAGSIPVETAIKLASLGVLMLVLASSIVKQAKTVPTVLDLEEIKGQNPEHSKASAQPLKK